MVERPVRNMLPVVGVVGVVVRVVISKGREEEAGEEEEEVGEEEEEIGEKEGKKEGGEENS